MRFFKEDSVLLVVDMQERLVPAMKDSEQLTSNVEKLVEGAKILGVPTVFTQQYTKGLGETLESIRKISEPFNYFEKKEFSCVQNLEVEQELARIGNKNIIVCGVESHVCVLQTSIDLMENGFTTMVVSDCVASRKQSDKDTAFDRMASEGVIFTSYEAILFEMVGSADDENFRAISKLIK